MKTISNVFKHPGMTDESGRPVEICILAPATHMGGWVVETMADEKHYTYVCMDRGAYKAYIQRLLEAM